MGHSEQCDCSGTRPIVPIHIVRENEKDLAMYFELVQPPRKPSLYSLMEIFPQVCPTLFLVQ